jgi:hypothetical protein
MVIPINVIHYGVAQDSAAGWQTGFADYLPGGETLQETGILAPARGMIWGLLLSGAMWVGLVAAARAVLWLAR